MRHSHSHILNTQHEKGSNVEVEHNVKRSIRSDNKTHLHTFCGHLTWIRAEGQEGQEGSEGVYGTQHDGSHIIQTVRYHQSLERVMQVVLIALLYIVKHLSRRRASFNCRNSTTLPSRWRRQSGPPSKTCSLQRTGCRYRRPNITRTFCIQTFPG